MTRINRMGTVLAAAVGALLVTQSALAQRAGEVTVEVGDCLEIEAPAERLACFERRVEEARGGRDAAPRLRRRPPQRHPAGGDAPAAPAAQAPAATPPAPAARAPAPADDDSFGRSTAHAFAKGARAAREAEEEQEPRRAHRADRESRGGPRDDTEQPARSRSTTARSGGRTGRSSIRSSPAMKFGFTPEDG